ncbi:MAG: NUDIX hydrolase [uncultured bacterium]|nr:MAG: NUDIX hydrolase [uncultured bacterium]
MKKQGKVTFLDKDEFDLSLELAPRGVLELVIRREDGVLLLHREDPPYQGTWHFPGGFMAKGETLAACLSRLLKKELGIDMDAEVIGFRKLDYYSRPDTDPRGHLMHHTIEVFLTESQIEGIQRGKFFYSIPPDIMPHHGRFFRDVMRDEWRRSEQALLDMALANVEPPRFEWVAALFDPGPGPY